MTILGQNEKEIKKFGAFPSTNLRLFLIRAENGSWKFYPTTAATTWGWCTFAKWGYFSTFGLLFGKNAKI